MNKIGKNKKTVELLGICILCLHLFSGLFISGIAKLDPYGSIFNYVQFFLLFVFFIFYFIQNKGIRNWKDPYLITICLFLVSSFITLLINPSIINNGKMVIMTLIQWTILFLFAKEHKKKMYTVLNLLNYLIFIFSFLSLCLFMLNITVTYSLDRYAGIYANPNMGGVIACVSIGISMILLGKADVKKKVFLGINLFIQILFVRVSLSRAAFLMMWGMVVVFVFMASLIYTKKAMLIMRNLAIVCVSVFLVYSFVGDGLYGIRSSTIARQNPEQIAKDTPSNESEGTSSAPVEKEETPEEEARKEKEEELSENIKNGTRNEEWQKESTNYRITLLKYGFRTCLDKPMFGQGIRNLPTAVEKVAGKKLSGIVGGGVHNSYLQLFISNGLLGFVSFAGIHCVLIYNLFKRRKAIFALKEKQRILWFSGFLALYFGLLVYGLFESILIMNSSFVTGMFAIAAGGLRDE